MRGERLARAVDVVAEPAMAGDQPEILAARDRTPDHSRKFPTGSPSTAPAVLGAVGVPRHADMAAAGVDVAEEALQPVGAVVAAAARGVVQHIDRGAAQPAGIGGIGAPAGFFVLGGRASGRSDAMALAGGRRAAARGPRGSSNRPRRS